MPSDKKMKRLEALLDTFDSGAVQPEELIEAIEGLMAIINQSQKALSENIQKESAGNKAELQDLERRVSQATRELENLIDELDGKGQTTTAEIKKMVAAEVKRVESLIPELPPGFDATDLWNSLKEHKALLEGLSTLILGENIRNALEVLPEGEKLAIEAIEGLQEALDKRQEVQTQATALIARYLYQIGDVDVSGAANGDVLTYDSATRTWKAEAGGGGGGSDDQTAAEVPFTPAGTIAATDVQAALEELDADIQGLSVGAGISRTIVVTSGNVTAGSAATTDYVYKVSGAHTVTLPSAIANNNQYDIINLHSANNSIATTSSQTIHGTASPITIVPNQSLTIQSDGANWMIK